MKIVISGYYGFSNTGDEAILKVITSFLKDNEIVVLSAKKNYFANSIYRYNFFRILKELKSSQILLSGGGGLLQDKTSFKSLIYYLSIIYLAKLLKLKVVIFSQSIGPITKKTGKFLTSRILNKVDMITVRDRNSLNILKELKVEKPEIFLTADLAFLLKEPDKERVEEILIKENIDKNFSYLAIVIRPWRGLLIEEIIKFIKIFKEKYRMWKIVLIPFQYSEDYQLLKNIKKEISEVLLIENQYLPEEILGIIKNMDFLVGMRLHSLIFAGISNVPYIGIIYDKKVEEFLKETAQEGLKVEGITAEKIFKKVSEKIERIEEIKNILKIKMDILKEKAEENFDLLYKKIFWVYY